jgi:hypothetical protein
MSVLSQQLQQQLEHLLSIARKRKLLQLGINWLPLSIMTLAILLLWTQSWLLSGVLTLLILVLNIIALTQTKAYGSIDLTKMLLHYNRQFPELEESAQLVLTAPSTLLQGLQAQKVAARFSQLVAQQHPQLIPRYSLQKGIFRALVTTVLLIAMWHIDLSVFKPELSAELTPPTQTNMQAISLLSATITVSAPAYTQLPISHVNELDLTVISGAKVSWRLIFADTKRDYYIQFDGGEREALNQQEDLSFTFEKLVKRTGVYAIGSGEQSISGIFTLSVIADKKPSIQIISPQKTVTEFPKNLQPELTAEVEIDDDFGLSKIEIIASVAKGSGEAVKFRDQLFSFDSSREVDGKPHYYKTWRLSELGMEPGDEMYFSVIATDNREPEPQQSRSQIKIIRWLEDEQNLLQSDGILIDFMPEYFKSQRQIIIETEQLIADEKNLTQAEFARTSQLLGNAQSDLKEKYGQYLGDEVDDGSGGHKMEAGANFTPGEADHKHEEQDSGKDKSGFDKIIEQYGHAHGDSEIGIITKLSPVGLMKRAIANMWEAELQLMLSQPLLALPFEKEALQYLNQAKKAERIYVKRLGFEPPPVSETRRYQGDQSEILSYQRIEHVSIGEDKGQDIVLLLQEINKLQNQATDSAQQKVDGDTSKLISKVKQHLLSLTQQRPELIEYVAILENIQQQHSLYLVQCDDCLKRLNTQLWQLLPDTISRPMTRKTSYLYENTSLREYGEFLRQSGEMQQ